MKAAQRWPVTDSPYSIAELMTGTFRLNPSRDLRLLRALPEHNFVTTRQFIALRCFSSQKRAASHLAD